MDITVLQGNGYNHIHIRLNVPACVHTCILVCMLVCMLVHLCLCVSNSPHTSIPSHACVHEGFGSSWSCIMMTCNLCVCSCICTVAHGYSQLYEGLKVHRPAHTCICAPARTFHGTNKLATTELQLYPAVISPSVFATLSGYTCWPSAVIPSGYNRYLFFM